MANISFGVHTTADQGFGLMGFEWKTQMGSKMSCAPARAHESANKNPQELAIGRGVVFDSSIRRIYKGEVVYTAWIPDPNQDAERRGDIKKPRRFIPIKQSTAYPKAGFGSSLRSPSGAPVVFSTINGMNKYARLICKGVALANWSLEDGLGDDVAGDRLLEVIFTGDTKCYFTGKQCKSGDLIFAEVTEDPPSAPGTTDKRHRPLHVAVTPSSVASDIEQTMEDMCQYYDKHLPLIKQKRESKEYKDFLYGKNVYNGRKDNDQWRSLSIRYVLDELKNELSVDQTEDACTRLTNKDNSPYTGDGTPVWPFMKVYERDMDVFRNDVRTVYYDEALQLAFITYQHAVMRALPFLAGRITTSQRDAFANRLVCLYANTVASITARCQETRQSTYVGKALSDASGPGPIDISLGS